MPLISKPNYNQIFASQAPEQDKPAVFNNYPSGWGVESRPNNGKPTIKGFNYLQQTSDLKDLWILQNGACLPYDESIEYADGAPVLKDGVIQYKTASGFKSRDAVTVPTYSSAADGVDPVAGVADGAYFNVRSADEDTMLVEYQNVGGSAVATGKSYLSTIGVQEITDSIGANWRNKPAGYGIGDKVRLLNGTLVESITAGNTSNPNTDMSDWIDNPRAEFSANLVDYLSRQDYKRMLNRDKTLDITATLNSILSKFHSKRTDGSDTYSNAQGICKVRIPKGVFVISDTITMLSPLGLIFEGDGSATTVLLYNKDSGNVFNFQTYLGLKFKDMSIIHQPVSSDKSTWTNTLFNLNGTGGGQRFSLEGVATVGFNIVQKLNHNVNEDTNYAEYSQFRGFNTFLHSRSSQAVNNSYTRCSWSGHGTVFDVANYGHTQISDSGIIVGGSWFKLADATIYGPTAQFTLTNVKGEWMNAETGSQSLGTTKIISAADSATLVAYFKFIKCGIAGGSPDPLVNHFDLQTIGVTIDVDGGEWSGVNIATKSKSIGTDRANRSWIRFANCAVPPNRNIIRIAGEGDSSHQPVIFENNFDCFDIVMLGTGLSTSRLMTPSKVENHNTIRNRLGRILYTPSESHVIETYGQRVNIEDVKIYVASSVGTVNCKAMFYTDSGRTNSIGEVSIPASASPQVIPVPLTGSTVTNEGLYIDVVADNNSNIPGYIKCKSVSF